MGTGSALASVSPPKSTEELFFLHSIERGEHWYGPEFVNINNQEVELARAVYAVYRGHTYKNRLIVSNCGDERCVKPEHLEETDPPRTRRHGSDGPITFDSRGRPTAMAGYFSNQPLREYHPGGGEELTRKMYELYEAGWSQQEVASIYGVSQAMVSSRFRGAGLPTRSTAEGNRIAQKRMREGIYTVTKLSPQDVIDAAE